MRVAAGVFCTILLLGACSPAPEEQRSAGPARDRCAGLEDAVERIVCADEDLRAMDADLKRLYQRALARADHTAKASLRNEHAAWERGLRDCLEAPEAERFDCLDERYNARIVHLAPAL